MMLNSDQLELATWVGKLRTASGFGRGDYLSCDRAFSGSFDIQASIAECALALRTGFPWRAYKPAGEHRGRGVVQEPDVGPIEVKSVSKAHHKIILHSTPLLMAPHVRLLVNGPEVTFTGWAFGFEIWNKKYWDESLPSPAYARKDLYGLESFWNWCKQSGLEISPVAKPNFAEGWEPR